jgi:tRNA(Ile)-lysidine synthase
VPEYPCVAVAYSGGRDSTALLHATLAAAGERLRVAALHVHHGLSPNADDWLDHCRRTCDRWRRAGRPLAFASFRLTGEPPAAASVEAWAREQRYRALREMAAAAGATLVLLGHHRRDQAETFLLQALRGAGVDGLAAMPRVQQRGGVTWMRPWLDLEPAAIEAYVRRHRLRVIDDESNADPRFARSRLRTVVWPAFEQAFPDGEAALARSARWAAQAAAALDDLAQLDLAAAVAQGRLRVAALAPLAGHRRQLALRAWLKAGLGQPPPASLLERLQDELAQARSAAWPCPGGELRLVRGWLQLVRAPGSQADAVTASPDPSGARVLRFDGWAGSLMVRPVSEGGLPAERLACAEARARCGAETFQAGPNRPPRSLKKQYQAAGIDRWNRDHPLIYDGDTLLFVPGLGVDARVRAKPGEAQVALAWQPDAGAGRADGGAGAATRRSEGAASGSPD